MRHQFVFGRQNACQVGEGRCRCHLHHIRAAGFFTRALSGPPQDETAELGVTSKSRPAVCSSPAKSSLATSFDAVDDCERISSARISSAVEQFVEKTRSDVNCLDDASMQRGELKSRFDAHDNAAHAEAVRVRNRKHYSLAPL